MPRPADSAAFRPSWWCPGPHLQTIIARFFRSHPNKLPLRREVLNTPDDDFLELDYLEGHAAAPWVVVLHGLEGSTHAPYMMSFLAQVRLAGWSACSVNFRGCSGRPNKLKTTYHSGKTTDLDFVLSHMLRLAGQKPIYLVGFSIGGNIVLKWLGERSETARPVIRRAAAVSVPYDLVKSVGFMDRGFNREVYTRVLLSSLKRKALHKAQVYPGCLDEKSVRRCRTFAAFDRQVTAPLNGFRDELQYWRESSASRYLHSIRVPSLLIHSEDDPFFPGKVFPYHETAAHPFVKVLMTEKGGHLGYMAGRWPWSQEKWLEDTILGFFQEDELSRG